MLVLLAGAFAYFSVFGKKSKPDLKTFGSVGDLAAEEIAKLLGKSGRLVLVYDVYDPKSGGSQAGKPFEAHWAQAEALRRRIAKLGTYTFASDWKLPRPNLSFYSVWPAGNFQQLLGANPPETTIVMFANPPAFTAEEKHALKSRPGKLVLVGGVLPEVRGLLKERVASLVVASRYPVPPAVKTPESERELMLRVYAALTPDSADQP